MSAASGTSATGGQAPAGDGANAGQAPQANNNSGTPQAPASQGQASGDHTTTGSATASLSPAEYERMIAELRREAAGHRTKAGDFEKQLKALQDASLTAEQKRERDLTELQATKLDYERRLQRQGLEIAGYRLAGTLGIGDIGAALAILQVEHEADVEYDEKTGAPTNLDKLLAKVLQAHPSLAAAGAASGQLTRQPMGSGGATNPGAGARPGGPFTREQIAKMTTREYEQNRAAIMESLKQGAIRPNT